MKHLRNLILLIAPTVPILPFKIGEKIDDPVSLFLVDINTVTANLTGKPAISIPFKIVNGSANWNSANGKFHER